MSFRRQFHLFTIAGFRVGLHPSWLILGLLIAWTLAAGYFPPRYPSLTAGTYWTMGTFGAIGLLVSIVIHELCHSLVARLYGLNIRGITLFIFGGVAEMEDEPGEPRVEFLMAGAGPLSSLILGALFYQLGRLADALNLALPVPAVFAYLAFINVVLAIFNLVPAFPLDGGRILRSILWWWRGSLKWATRVTSRLGDMFGMLLVAMGVLNLIGGDFIGGMWMALIGMFLREAASQSYQSLVIKQLLQGEPLRRFMKAKSDVILAPADISLDHLVEDYLYRYHHELYPVVVDDRLMGCVGLRDLAAVPRSEWTHRRVVDITRPCTADNTIPPDTDAVHALAQMHRTGNSRLMVVEGDRLVGLITLKDLLQFISLKVALSENHA